MANHSKVILKESSSAHISRLVRSVQSLKNLEDYSIKPEGVWGSKATIKFANAKIDASTLDVEFTIPFDDDLETNEGEIVVYNLTDNTIRQLKGDVTIEAGFEGDTGVIFSGKTRKVHSKREGADRATIVKAIDGVTTTTEGLISSGRLEESYDGVPAKDVLRALLEAEGSPIAKFEVESDYAYENSVTLGDDLQAEIKKYSEVCGVSTFKRKGKIYCCKLDKVENGITFNVSEETGMIGSPSPFEETITVGDDEVTVKGFEIEMLLQHRAAVGAIVNLMSEQYKGKYYIKSGTHRFNSSEATTTIKVVEM